MHDAERSPVFRAEDDDPEMARAMARAVSTFKYLWRELTWEYRRIVPALDLSAVKAAFRDPDGDAVEHMWLSEIEFDGDTVSAVLLNSPNAFDSARAGDRVTLRPDEIEDWMYVVDGRVYGGFTVQALRARMSSSERRSHDEAWGLEFPDPSRVELVPRWEEVGKKQGLLRSLLGRGPDASPADPDQEHPMSEHVAASLAEDVAKDPESFFRVDESGLNTLHSLALGGSAACVRVLLEHGADPWVETRTGRTARDLAEQMNWPRVVALLRTAEASR